MYAAPIFFGHFFRPGSASGSLDTYNVTEVPGGNATASDSYKLVLSGTFSNGIFTITGGTGTETGSYNSSQNNTTTTTSPTTGSTTSDEWDSTNSDNYTVSMGLGLNSSGQLVFTSYTLTETATAYYHTHVADSDGSYDDDSYTATTPMNTSGSGTTGSYSANETLDAKWDDYQPGGGSGNSSGENDQTNPASGTVDLSGLLPQTSGWQWFAGAPNAQNYTFHAVFSENATLGETATLQSHGSGSSPTILVNSFNSYYQGTVSAHTVDDEPETPASLGGADSFHRDETYGNSDTATGSGSYGGDNTNAVFQSVQVATFNVVDTETDDNETVTGTDSSGNTYTTTYNYGGQVNGSGSFSVTNNFQDVGNGLTLTSESFQVSGLGNSSYQFSGTANGQAFDDSSTEPETWNEPQETIPGAPGPITNPDGLVNAFPYQDTAQPNGAVFQAPAAWPGVFLQVNPARSVAKGVQSLYNYFVERAGEGAKKKVADAATHKAVMDQIRLTQMATGTFTLEGPDGTPRGNTFAQAMGKDDVKTLEDKQKVQLQTLNNPKDLNPYTNVQLDRTDVVITYAVDGGALTPRSGNVGILYKYQQTFTATRNSDGQQVTLRYILFNGAATFHDDNLENMSGLKESK